MGACDGCPRHTRAHHARTDRVCRADGSSHVRTNNAGSYHTCSDLAAPYHRRSHYSFTDGSTYDVGTHCFTDGITFVCSDQRAYLPDRVTNKHTNNSSNGRPDQRAHRTDYRITHTHSNNNCARDVRASDPSSCHVVADNPGTNGHASFLAANHQSAVDQSAQHRCANRRSVGTHHERPHHTRANDARTDHVCSAHGSSHVRTNVGGSYHGCPNHNYPDFDFPHHCFAVGRAHDSVTHNCTVGIAHGRAGRPAYRPYHVTNKHTDGSANGPPDQRANVPDCVANKCAIGSTDDVGTHHCVADVCSNNNRTHHARASDSSTCNVVTNYPGTYDVSSFMAPDNEGSMDESADHFHAHK